MFPITAALQGLLFFILHRLLYFLDPNTFLSGNAAIQPSISNAASIRWLLKQFLFSISYMYENNFITNFQSAY